MTTLPDHSDGHFAKGEIIALAVIIILAIIFMPFLISLAQ